MTDDYLSQDEIDALIQDPAVGADEPSPAAVPAGVEPYDLARQERIVRGRMPALELIHERFARNLRLGLFAFMRRNPELAIEPITIGKYASFTAALALPSNINILQVRPLGGSALLVLDTPLVASIIDIMFGGSGRIDRQLDGREFSATEQRLIQRLVELVLGEYRRAWEGVYPLEMIYTRSELQPQFASIAPATEIVVTASFAVNFGDTGGTIRFCIPYTVLEPIRETLFSSFNASGTAQERGWLGTLTREIKPATIDLVAELTTAQVTIGQLMHLEPGDIIEIDAGPLATLKVGDVPVFSGRYGEHAGRYAVRIDQVLTPSRSLED